MHFINVDLPEPDLPVRATISPSSTSKDTCRNASISFSLRIWSSNCFCRFTTSSSFPIYSSFFVYDRLRRHPPHFLEQRTDKKLRISVLWILQDLIGQPLLHNLPVLQHHRAVG